MNYSNNMVQQQSYNNHTLMRKLSQHIDIPADNRRLPVSPDVSMPNNVGS